MAKNSFVVGVPLRKKLNIINWVWVRISPGDNMS